MVLFDVGLVAWLGRAGLHPHLIVGTTGDPDIYYWFLHWWGWAIAHHHLSRVTPLVTVPYGNNVLWDTGMPLVFLPTSLLHQFLHIPVPILYNALWVFSWAGSAIVAYGTFMRLTHHPLGSFIGQVLVLLSAYENTESLAHLDLMWLGFAFLFFMSGAEWWMGRRSTRSWVIWGAIWGLLQWFTNEEIFVLMWIAAVLAIGIAWCQAWLTGRWNRRQEAVRLRDMALVVGISAAAILPAYWLQSHAPLQPLASIRFSGAFGVDLQNLLWVPVHTIWHWGNPRAWGPDLYEDTGYLGMPFLTGALVYWLYHRNAWSSAQRHVARWLLLWWALLVVLALGAFVRWNGHTSAYGALPGLFFYFLPVLRDVVMPRFMGIAFWVVGLAAALALKTASRRSTPVLVAGLTLIAVSWMPAPFPSMNPARGQPALSRTLAHLPLGAHPVILVFPYDNVGDPTSLMGDQAHDNFRFRLAEGYLSPSDALLFHFPRLVAAWDRLDAPTLNPDDHARVFPAARWRPAVRRYLTTAHPAALLVLRHTPQVHATLRWWTVLLGVPSGQTPAAVYWLHPRIRGSTPAGRQP